MRSQRKGSKTGEQYFSASHFVHVRPMFEVAWIPFLAGLSGPLQGTDDLDIVELCLDGFKSAIRIVCLGPAVEIAFRLHNRPVRNGPIQRSCRQR